MTSREFATSREFLTLCDATIFVDVLPIDREDDFSAHSSSSVSSAMTADKKKRMFGGMFGKKKEYVDAFY